MPQRAALVLENGKVFQGWAFGREGAVTGEIVFTTGMTGYLETLTDPSYAGQIIVQTFPLIGNYGVIPEDFESDHIAAKGYILKHGCQEPSNFRSEGNLDTFLAQRGVVGLCGIDTRALTRILREHGVMNGSIVPVAEDANLEEIRAYHAVRPVAQVSTKVEKTLTPGSPRRRVVLWDFGYKAHIARRLLERDCEVIVVPHDTPYKRFLELQPDGILLSNGPGDPADNPEIIVTLRKLLTSGIPLFGICLGHQLLALAHGFRTEKLKYGHRGANQPVQDVTTGQVYITSQNHGYAVVTDSIDLEKARPLYENVNDRTSEGIEYLESPAFSVQFHPEACGGPRDTSFLFDRFMQMMEVTRHAAQ